MRSYRILIVVSLLLIAAGVACRRAPQRVTEVVAASVTAVPLNPADSAWDRAPEHVARLILQDLVEPRQMKATTPEVAVRALTNGSEIAFRLEWTDREKNDLPGAGSMVDACAIQLPRKIDPNPPAPQMGEAAKPVEVAFWRADWQASVDGRGDSIRDLYPNASIDHYPFEATPLEPGSAAQKEFASRYSPARALGNARGGPRQSPVEDMVAEGPGTLAPAGATTSKGQGRRTDTGWSVVISRRLPQGLAPRQRTQIAFAVWEGSQKEAGARKMRTGWIPLLVQGEK